MCPTAVALHFRKDKGMPQRMDPKDQHAGDGLWVEGHEASAGRGAMSGPSFSEEPSCKPWGAWLTFLDPELETEFWSIRASNLLRGMDCIAYAYSLLYFLAMELQYSVMGGSAGGMVQMMDLFPALFFMLVVWAAVESCKWSDWYKSHRSVFVGAVRILSSISCLRYASVFEPPTANILTFYHALFRKSTLTVMAISPFILQLSFRLHTAVGSASLLVALLWATPKYCRAWTGAKEFMSAAAQVERGINTLMMLVGSVQAQSNAQIQSEWSCLLVVAFSQIVVGFIVPSAAVYAFECYIRCQYLLQKFPSARRFCLPDWQGLAVLMIGTVAVVSSVTWLGLVAALELGEGQLNFATVVSNLVAECEDTPSTTAKG